MTGIDQKSVVTVLLAAGIILPAAALFSFIADLPHVLLLITIGLTASMLIIKPVKITDRSIIYFSVMTVVLTVLLDYMFPIKTERFGFIGIFFHPEISAPIVLYGAVFITFFRSGPYVLGVAAAAALFSLMFAGDVYNLNIPNERLPMPGSVIKHFKTTFLIVISINLFFILLSFRISVAQKISRQLQAYRWRKRFILVLIFVLLPLCVTGALKLYKMNEDRIRRLENIIMRLGVRRMAPSTKHTVFSREVDLNRTISEEVVKNQNIIVLRVVAKQTPGYLRGHAYVNYSHGRWLESSYQNVRQLKNKTYSGLLVVKSFFLETDRKHKFAFEIQPAKNFSSKLLLIPADVQQLDIIANRIACSRDGMFEPVDWEKVGGYTAFTSQPAIESAWQEPAEPASIREYLDLQPEIAQQLNELAGNMPELKKLQSKASDGEIILALLKFFSSQFTYKLSAQDTGNADPVIHFLTKTKAGHCELFASSMALLLRTRGIPTRYVTGFVCEERHPSGKYYIARLGNAHAWLEAYDREHKKWVMLEPTPPSGIPNFKYEMDPWESAGDRFKQFFQQLMSDLRRGYFAKVITDASAGIYELFGKMVFHPVRGPVCLLLLVAALIIYLRRRRVRMKKDKCIAELHRNVAKLSREYSRIASMLRKKYHLEITGNTTVAEFSAMINNLNIPPAEIQRITAALQEYQQLRFRETPPTDKELHQAKNRLSHALIPESWKTCISVKNS